MPWVLNLTLVWYTETRISKAGYILSSTSGHYLPERKVGQEPGFNKSNGIGRTICYIYVV